MATSADLLSLPPYCTTSLSRLQSLYSDISRQKHSNPAAYNSNVEWWRRALESIASSGFVSRYRISGNVDDGSQSNGGSMLVVDLDRSLLEFLRVEGVGKPLALAAVVPELVQASALVPYSSFLTWQKSIYDPGWLPARIASYVIGKPLWWALEHLGVVGEEGFLASTASYKDDTSWQGSYVIKSLVEGAAEHLIHKQSKLSAGGVAHRLYTFDGFRSQFADVLAGSAKGGLMDSRDAHVLLRHLERDRKVLIVDKEVIKFIDAGAPRELRQISAIDHGILELKTAVHSMHMQIESIQQRIDETAAKVTAALKQNRKTIALSYLRSRKQLEDLLTKRFGSLEILESTMIRVEAAAEDVQIMRSYETSTATLRSILSHPLLQRDRIDDTMDAMAQAASDAKEVDDAVRIGGDAALGIEVDEADLEAELNTLAMEVRNERQREELQELASVNPRVPTQIPVEEKVAEVRVAVASL